MEHKSVLSIAYAQAIFPQNASNLRPILKQQLSAPE